MIGGRQGARVSRAVLRQFFRGTPLFIQILIIYLHACPQSGIEFPNFARA